MQEMFATLAKQIFGQSSRHGDQQITRLQWTLPCDDFAVLMIRNRVTAWRRPIIERESHDFKPCIPSQLALSAALPKSGEPRAACLAVVRNGMTALQGEQGILNRIER